MADEMTVPFVLGLIGGIFILFASLAGLWIGIILVNSLGGFEEVARQSTVGIAAIPLVGPIVELIFATIIIVGSRMMRNLDKAKTFSIIVLVLSIISLINFTALYGRIIVPILGTVGVIGSILAIVGGALGFSKAK